MSDQHGNLDVRVPECDVLIHAGDVAPDKERGQLVARVDSRWQVDWIKNSWVPWRLRQPAKYCICDWGNHDYCGVAINRSASVVEFGRTKFVVDDLAVIDGLKIWVTPWSSRFRDWAFMQDEARLKDLYSLIPDGLDILVTHQPPFGYGDAGGYLIGGDGSAVEHLGSASLLTAILRARPKVVICGHVHGAYGRYEIEVPDAESVILYNVAVLNEAYQLVRKPTLIKEFV